MNLDESAEYATIGSWLGDEMSGATYDYVQRTTLNFSKLKIDSPVVTKSKNLTIVIH